MTRVGSISNREHKTQQARAIGLRQQATWWKWSKAPYKARAHSFGGIAKQRTSPRNIFGDIVTPFLFIGTSLYSNEFI